MNDELHILRLRERPARHRAPRVAWYDTGHGRNDNPRAKTLEKVATAFGATLANLFVDADGESVPLR